MELELGRALAHGASPGVSRASLERLDDTVESVVRRIRTGIEAEEHGYNALSLPDRVDPNRIEEVSDELEGDGAVLVIGMGGSALGARAVAQALAPTQTCYVLDAIDPAYLNRVLSAIDLTNARLHVVSKSGTTVETRATFRVVRERMAEAGVDWTERTLGTTDPTGPLGQQLKEADVPLLAPPAGVPGRYSVLSTMALPSLAMLGIDIEALLAGGQAAKDALRPSLFDSPPVAYGATMAALAARGATQNVLLPYAEALSATGDWFAQLWAESLGKDGLGQTPIAGRGIADHHSQLQRWRDGRRDTVVTVLNVETTPDEAVPPAGDDLDGTTLASLVDIERRALEAGLALAHRPTVRIDIPEVHAEALGEVLVGLQLACITYGELIGVDPFDQPAVEWGKQATRDVLAGRTTERTEHLRDDTGLRIS